MISESNKIIQALWIGGELSLMEQLTINSFIKHGHTFHLYCYEEITTKLPKELIVKDANEILDKKHVFSYNNYNQFGHGKGSVSGFSDIFRYKLLHDKGNWWVDMDVTCLAPLNIETDYYFRKHHELDAVGNVMKVPKGSALMKHCFEKAFAEVDANNKDWHKPINILNEGIQKLDLSMFIGDGISNRDWWVELLAFLYSNKKFPEAWKFVHWTNENFRAYHMDKSKFKINSSYGKLLFENEVVRNHFTFSEKLSNAMKYNSIHKLIKGYYKPF